MLGLITFLWIQNALAADKINLLPGQYESEFIVTMQGMPMKVPPRSFKQKHCVTEKDLESKEQFLKKMQSDSNCKISKLQFKGDSATWKMECDVGNGKMNGEGKAKWTSAGSEGETTLYMQAPGQKTKISTNNKFKSKRIGECEKN